ncbi:threonine ammonia-lyase, biosynthetic [Batrachochytrium salamandrivorans]|nr:threonine ammonia-lyase, biosynthetic [Batrachochytrium salamandrivorans]
MTNKHSSASEIEAGASLRTSMSALLPLVWPQSSLPLKAVRNTTLNTRPSTGEPEIDYLKLILNARVYDVANETPLTYASKGVALAANKLGIKATIVMPTFAPEIKVENVRRLGATVVLFGNDFDAAKKECTRLAIEKDLIFIPPFDDPYVIAGQGTVGVEILRQIKQDRLDAIFVCCGGGGLIAGIAAYVKRIRPEVQIIGVNTHDSDSMFKSLCAGKQTEIKEAGSFADGTSIRLPGAECVRLCKELVDNMVLVSNDEICAAIKDTFDDTRSILEPAGAQSLAGLKRFLADNPHIRDGVFVAVNTGANMNFDRLRFVAERTKIGQGTEALMVLIPETPGSLVRLHNLLSPRFVTELAYRFSNPDSAQVMIAFDVLDQQGDAGKVMNSIHGVGPGWSVIDISNNEMAKSHGRFLAGGRSSTVKNEVLYRFNFPDRPGSLQKFMDILDKGAYNVTLFHYRNNGADLGRVLAGLQVPPERASAFSTFVQDLRKAGYMQIVEETDNPVYKHFLI